MSERLRDRFNLRLMLLSAFFLAAPFWVPLMRVVYRHNSFLRTDSVVLLGLSLLLALVFRSRMPDPQKLHNRLNRPGSGFPLAVLLLAAVGLVLVNRLVLHRFLNSADEHSCYFLAECFRLGKWRVSPPDLSEFFNVVHVGNRDGKWFSVYPPGWPLLYALGLQWHLTDFMNPAVSVIALGFFYLIARKLHDPCTAKLALLFTVLTPFFLFTGASYYSHSTCLACMMIFAYAFLRWQEAGGKDRNGWAMLAAAACGYGLITRYLTMAAFAAPFLLMHYWPVLRRQRKIRSDDVLAAGILVLFMGIVFWQNLAVTGKLFKAPNKYDKSWERLGFRDDYNPLDGLVFIVTRFFYMMDWTPPLYPFLFFAVLWRRDREPSRIHSLFRYAFFYSSFVYFLYFSWGGNQYGPRYWYEGFPFLILTMTAGIKRWEEVAPEKTRRFLSALVLLAFISGLYPMVKQSVAFEEISRQRRALYDLGDQTLKKPSIVYIRGFLGDRLVMGEEDAVRNSPRMDALILYAHDRGDDNTRLVNRYPERQHYVGWYDPEHSRARLEEIPPGEMTP